MHDSINWLNCISGSHKQVYIHVRNWQKKKQKTKKIQTITKCIRMWNDDDKLITSKTIFYEIILFQTELNMNKNE